MTLTPKILFIMSLLTLAACSPEVRFAEIPFNAKAAVPVDDIPYTPDPIPEPTPTPQPTPEPTPEPTPTPTPTPPPPPVYNKNSGACAADSSTSVTGGMKCLVPVIPPEEPPMSLKAQRLMASMTHACQVNNTSYGSNYRSPAAAAHLAKLNRCSSVTYRDTTMTAAQTSTITTLASGDSTLVNRMFSGLWYQPPYSDHFETYFGIMVQDAVRVFCLQDGSFPTLVYPLGYFEGIMDNPNYRMPQDYVLANQYLASLRSCMNESLTNPWKPGPVPPAKTCDFETLSGPAGAKINSQVTEWLAKGQKVSADILNQGKSITVTSVDQLSGYTGDILVGTYVCK